MSASPTPSPDDSRHPHPGLLADVAQVVHVVTGRAPDEVLPDRAFVADLRVDSLAMVEILEGLSHQLGVRIEDEAAKDFVRVGDLLDYLAVRVR